jgi:hypothetical protein
MRGQRDDRFARMTVTRGVTGKTVPLRGTRTITSLG